jgi:outer membrane protein assembly factor BamB
MRFALAVLLLFPAALLADEAWPQFRGPGGKGLSPATNLPTQWSESSNIVWKTAIHDKGWSSPVVLGKQIWLTTAHSEGEDPTHPDRTKFYAVCIDRDSGKIIHDIQLFDVARPAFCIAFNSYASPTPVIEEGRVYVHFGAYGTACLDTATGKTLWTRTDLKCDHWRGPGSSPILWQNLIFLTFDGYDVQYVAALDKTSGKTVWKKDRTINYNTTNGDLKKGYGTPSLIMVNGKPQLVSSAAAGTISYEPRTGEEIWKVHHGGMNAATPPLYGNGLVYLTTGAGGDQLLAVRPEGTGDVTGSQVVWKHRKEVPTRPAPILDADLLYMVSDGGVVSCLEARDGTPIWSRRLNVKVTASLVLAGGKLYVFAEEVGKGFVLAAGRSEKLLATNLLDDGCMASPAIAGQALFVRTKTHLYRIEKK